jgi:hypothetical protein
VIKTVIAILNKFDLVIAREKLKTFHNNLKKIVGINLQFGKLSIPRKIRRSMRALTHQLRNSGVISANQIHKGLALYNLRRIDRSLIKEKGTIEAATAGFMAYVIHVERLLI